MSYPFGQVRAAGRACRSRPRCVEAPAMASRRKTATARRTPARSSRPARKRAAPARRARVREPLLAPHQYRDLAGLALFALAAFSALVVWLEAGGGSLGGALRGGFELINGRAVAVAPLVLAALGASLLMHADARRLRPFRFGAICSRLACCRCSDPPGLDDHALRHGGGYLGNGLHGAVGSWPASLARS